MAAMKPTERLLGMLRRTERPRVAALFDLLSDASDVEAEAQAIGFVPTSREAYGVGVADDSQVVRGDYVLLSTAWRRTEPHRDRTAPLPPTLWLFLGRLLRPIRTWSLPDTTLERL